MGEGVWRRGGGIGAPGERRNLMKEGTRFRRGEGTGGRISSSFIRDNLRYASRGFIATTRLDPPRPPPPPG